MSSMLTPRLVRAVSNGRTPGAGMRLYVPGTLVRNLGLTSGTYWRLRAIPDGRIALIKVNAAVREAIRFGPIPQLAGPCIRFELNAAEASIIEEYLVTGNRNQRSTLLDVAKRLRRRMRLAGLQTPDRTDEHPEAKP